MSQAVNSLLRHAKADFHQRDEKKSLQGLLEVWRETRSERIAALAQKLSDRLLALPPVPSVNRSRQHDPIDLPGMLGRLMEAVKAGRMDTLRQQLAAFGKVPADPRLTPSLMAIARLPLAGQHEVLHQLRRLFLSQRDPRALESLRVLLAGLDTGDHYVRQFKNIIELTTRQKLPPLDEESRVLAEALEEAINERASAEARSAPIREALLARVYAQPDDDGARLVLADHLLEQGEPLGEFIMLQCSPRPDEVQVRALLERYGGVWETALGPLIHPGYTLFRRGFPASVLMNFGPQPWPPPGPAWGTVEEISWHWTSSPLAAAWLENPHLHGVKRMRGMQAAIGRCLGAYPLALRRLELQGGVYREPDTFTALSALPHLSWVDITEADPRDVGLCALSPLARRLERFTASAAGAWELVATPSEEVPVTAALSNWKHLGELAEAIRAAVRFGNRALRLRSSPEFDRAALRPLEEAGAAYGHIEWA
jgi:uncharacterized protein (TIGR02996 family)